MSQDSLLSHHCSIDANESPSVTTTPQTDETMDTTIPIAIIAVAGSGTKGNAYVSETINITCPH